jgi:Tol biopolymer transport system component
VVVPVNEKQNRGLDRFDRIIAAAIFGLCLAVAATVARGDQVGVAVQAFSPTGVGSSRTAIQVTFDQPIDTSSFQEHFSLSPAVQGHITTNNNQVVFQPNQPLQPGQAYSVTLQAGTLATAGRSLKAALSWRFTVRSPRIVYLGPPSSQIQNLYAIDPTAPESVRQLTNSANGIVGYDVSSDGGKIVYVEDVYSQAENKNITPLLVWDAATGRTTVLYDCKNAECTNPVWRSDGNAIAFERIDTNSGFGNATAASRLWLLDVASNTVKPLFSDSLQFADMPRWSPDGMQLAFFNTSQSALTIHNFSSNQDTSVPVELTQAQLGSFSPDGRWIYFSKLIMLDDGNYVTHFQLVDLTATPYRVHDLVAANTPVNDLEAAWQNDSKALIVLRQSATQAINQGSQLTRVDLATGAATTISAAEGYDQKNLRLSPAGDSVLVERTALGVAKPSPELWLTDLTTRKSSLVANEATSPGWLP